MTRISAALLSPNGKYLLVGSSQFDTVRLRNAETGEELRTYPFNGGGVNSLVFHPNGDTFFTGGRDESVRQWHLDNERIVKTFHGASNGVQELALSPDASRLYAVGNDHGIRIWDVASESLLVTLAVDTGRIQPRNWIAIAPDGRFDSNGLELVETMFWMSPDAPMSPLPLEMFMREFYEPRLLAKRHALTKLPPVPDLRSVNRVVPTVRIVHVEHAPGDTAFRVAVEARSERQLVKRFQRDSLMESGVVDLRLFRDGQLVGQRSGQLSPGRDGVVRHAFTVRSARRQNVDTAIFTAYAFNTDRVKSETHRAEWYLPTPSTRPRIAYIVGIGVGTNSEPAYTLTSGPPDAVSILDSLGAALDATGEFAVVNRIALVSALPPGAMSQRTLYRIPDDAIAPTRENIQAVLDVLAGRVVTPQRQAPIAPLAAKLRRAEPGDLVLVSFTGHGLVDSMRRDFVILPADATENRTAAAPFPKAISSNELSNWLREIDAGSMVLILSTCYSERAVASPTFRPGPMGEAGFGQLAYDKGMQVLVAAQNVATGLGANTTLGRALVEDGPREMRQRDRAVLADLLRFAEGALQDQAPQLFDFRRRPRDVLLYVRK